MKTSSWSDEAAAGHATSAAASAAIATGPRMNAQRQQLADREHHRDQHPDEPG